ncbi:MAG: AsmA family protein [Alphaproteobacteria bacterium]
MKKSFYAVAAVVVLVIGAALLAPSFIDRAYYVSEVQTRVKAMTGRDLTIAGKVDLSILPQPTVLVEDLRLSNAEGAAVPDMVTLKSLRLRVAILPLLAGRLEIASLSLNRPVVELETLANGQSNWRFAALTETDAAAPGKDEAAGETRGRGLIKLDRLTITDGVIVYRDSQSGLLERVNDLDAEVSIHSSKGPILATGSALPRGVPTRFDVSIGEIEPQKPVTIGATLAIEPGTSRLEFKGEASQAEAGGITGKLHAEANDLGKLLHAMFGETGAPSGLAQRFALSGIVAASAQRMSVSDIDIMLGESRATGSVESSFVKPARTAIKIVADRIDLDPLLAARPAPAAPSTGGKVAAPTTKPAAPAQSGATPAKGQKDGVALPSDLSGSVDVLAKTVVYRQGEVREAHLIAQLAGGQLTLQRAAARLPGDGTISLTGALTSRNGSPRFDGGLEFAANNARAILAWLGADVEGIAEDRLKKTSLSCRIAANGDEIQFRDLQAGFDATRVTGGITLAMRERPAFGAAIAIDRLALDAYLPSARQREGGNTDGAESGAAKSDQANSGGGGLASLSPLESFDANLQARVAQLSYGSTQIQGLALDGTLQGGVLTLKELSVQDLAGAQGKINAVMSGFSTTPQIKAGLDLRSNDLPRVLKLAGLNVPAAAEKLGRVTLTGSAKTADQDVVVDLGLGVWNGSARAKGRLADFAANPKYDLDLALDFPDAAAIVRTFSPDAPAGKIGAFKLSGKASGDRATLALSGLKGNLGASPLAGDLKAAFAQPRPKYSIALTTGELPLAALGFGGGAKAQVTAPAGSAKKGGAAAPKRASERWSRERMDLSALKSFDADLKLQASALRMEKYSIVDAVVDADVADGVLELRKLTGKLFDGELDAKAKLNAEGGTTAEIVLNQFDVDQALKGLADLDRASGRATVKSTLRATAKSEYDLVSTLSGQGSIDGNVTVRVKEKEMGGAAALGLLASQIKGLQGFAGATGALLSAFGSAPATLKGTFAADKGVIRTNDLRLESTQGIALVTGTVNLPPYTVDGQGKVSLKSAPNQPVLTVVATGSLDQPDLKVGGSAIQGTKPTAPGVIEQVVPGLGGQKPPSGPQQKPQSPKDQLKGILKGLGG